MSTLYKGRPSSAVMSLLGLSAIVLLSAGIALGAFFFANKTPSTLQAGKPVTSVPVTEREFDDKATVDVALSLGSDTKLSSPAAGLVTQLSCKVGETFSSGSSSLSLDGKPLLNLATATPLWRDLEWGNTGTDVDALHAELTRLGYDVTPDGQRAGNQTFLAVSQLMEKIGGSADLSGQIQASRILWLPSAETAVKSCAAVTGAPIAAGEEVAALPGSLTGARVKKLPEGPVAGDRVLAIDDQLVPVGADGSVTDPEALAQIGASSAFAQALQSKANTVSAVWNLKTPLSVFVVPPSSLYELEGSSGCVADNKRAYAVTVVGSELGQSFVTFDQGEAAKDVSLSPVGADKCR